MALFGRGKDKAEQSSQSSQIFPLVAKKAFCRICNADRTFTRCWRRAALVTQCPCCGTQFPDPGSLYQRILPVCPRCGEFLEQPNFDYGLCDGCGSKFELMDGTRPTLLPNQRQRHEMEKIGKSWTKK